MSSFAQTSAASTTGKDRRSQPRRRVEELAYGDFGPHNGGIILDVAEGGFAFQSVQPVEKGTSVSVKFKLPEVGLHIEASAEVAWLHDSGKRGGLRFLTLPENLRQQIQTWVGQDILNQPLADTQITPIDADAPVLEVPQEPKALVPFPDSGQTQTGTVPPVEPLTSIRNVRSPQLKWVESPVVQSVPSQAYEYQPQQSSLPPEPVPAASSPTALPVREPDLADSPAPRRASIPEFPIPSAAEITAAEARPNARPVVVESQRRRSTLEPETPRANPPAAEEFVREPLSSRAVDKRVAPARAMPAEAEPVFEGGQRDVRSPKINVSQLVTLGIGAAIGVCALIVIATLPALRAKVQGTGNRPAQAAENAAGTAFQVEVVDHDGRRWILQDGESAKLPENIQPSRRDTQPAAILRNDAPKQPPADTQGKARLSSAQELALKKPVLKEPSVAAADVREPSIFDGITPPIPSFDASTLAPASPDLPRSAQPQPAASARVANLQGATLTHRVEPIYPDLARRQRLQGEVRVSATVGNDGVPRNLKPLTGDPRLVNAALLAIGQWRYKPATLNGEAIESEVIVTIAFELK
jgi:TonB family protein